MATKDRVQNLMAVVDKVLAYKDKEMISRSAWGEISFAEAQFDIQTILDVAMGLKNLPLVYLPDQIANSARQQLEAALPTFAQIDSFKISNGDPSARKTQIIAQIHSHADSICLHVSSWVPYLSYRQGDVAQNISKLTSIIGEAQKMLDACRDKIAEKQKQADDILVKAREAAANAGASVFTLDFQEEAEINKRNSWMWLSGGIVLGLAALGIAIWAYCDDYSKYTTHFVLWPKLASKMLVLSLCVTAAMWCGRIYKSLRHLSIINRHRALGLKTFQAFSAASADACTKDAVLREVTHSIFAISSTGLIRESAESDPDSNIIQIAGKVMEHAEVK